MILAIYGAGGFGREVRDIAMRLNSRSSQWDEIIFIDDFQEEGDFDGTRRIHFSTLCETPEKYQSVVAVGEPQSREILFQKLVQAGIDIVTIIDPSALISPSAQIGQGSIICEFASIHCNVEIGKNCIVQPYSLFGHDIKTGDHCVFSVHFAPGGDSSFGKRVFAGMNSVSKEQLSIGDDAIFAMGAVVYQNVAAHAVMVGNPARQSLGNASGKVFR